VKEDWTLNSLPSATQCATNVTTADSPAIVAQHGQVGVIDEEEHAAPVASFDHRHDWHRRGLHSPKVAVAVVQRRVGREGYDWVTELPFRYPSVSG